MDSKYSLINSSNGGSSSSNNKLTSSSSPSNSYENCNNNNNGVNGFPIKRKILNNNSSSGSSNCKSNVNNSHEKSSKKLKNDIKISNKDTNVKKNTLENTREMIQQQRRSLPIFHCKQRFIQEIRKNDTILLMGETGSGKTTQIPQFLLDAGYGGNGIIAITQPRRVAAITVAKRVSQELNCKLGELVGFTVRFEDCTSKLTKIRFITDGSLLRETINDRLLKNYSCIILDEAHERSINTDVLFGIVKNAQKQRKSNNMQPLKIIVMSATMDIDHFSKYFGVRGMYLEGRTYPVRVWHTKESQSDYLQASLITLFQIHREAPSDHDVLIFLTGQEEIESISLQIRQIIKKNDLDAPLLRVFPLYSQLPQNKQLECFSQLPPNTRKVIIATNIAETSITIPGVRYVIDCGYVKRRVHDPITSLDSLKIVRISQAQSWQRCGRAGRESDGFCYRIYTQKEMENFEKMPKPEILRSNILSVVLQLLAIGIDCRTFDFLDKPSFESIDAALKQLQQLGAIKSIINPELTEDGKIMSKFPLDPRYSKLLLIAKQFDCIQEILSIVAILSGENIFITATEKREQANLAHAKFESKYGDHITLLNVYNGFSKAEKIKLWCHEHFLNVRNLLYAQDVRSQLKEICEKYNLLSSSSSLSHKNGNGYSNSDSNNNNNNITNNNNMDYKNVRKCLLSGLYNNIAEYQHKDNNYLIISSRQRAKIHPSSIFCGKTKPKLCIFTEVISTEKNFLKILTEIETEWITEVIPNYSYMNRIRGLLLNMNKSS